jgi:hypothetical protein
MEPDAAWVSPFEFQLAAATNWTAAAHDWAAPGAGQIPLEYASIVDIFGSSCSLQQAPYVVPASSSSSSSSSSGGQQQQQVVEYNYYNYYDYAAAAQHHHDPAAGEGTTTTQEKEKLGTYEKSPEKLFQETSEKFIKAGDANFIARKMHRYPPGIRDLGDWCTVPKVVAIGPYHHRRDHLQKAEEVKHVAAHHCLKAYQMVNIINDPGLSIRDMYHEVIVSVVEDIDARGLYDKDGMAGIGYVDDFLPMMFYDACFLVIYMLRKAGGLVEPVLYDFFESNDDGIAHDIMLLENQIPWAVVDAILNKCAFNPLAKLNKFIARWKDGWLQDRAFKEEEEPSAPEKPSGKIYNGKPPHLLGLLKFHMVGGESSTSTRTEVATPDLERMKSIPISAGAIELAEMGISLTAKKTTDELPVDMGLRNRWVIFAKLPMTPLSLNDLRASWLVNMAALELCTTPDFFMDRDKKKVKHEDSAVCSYLLLFCMLMHREEDVHELRKKGILKGAGLTNKKALQFFTSLESLRKGRSYARVMVAIEDYRMKRRWWLKLYTFWYRNQKTIGWAASAIGGFIGIIVTLMKLKEVL